MKRITLILLVIASVFGFSTSAMAATSQIHQSKVKKAVSAVKGASQKQANYGTHAEIRNFSHYSVIVRVPLSGDFDLTLYPGESDYIDSPVTEYCRDGRNGFDVIIFDTNYRTLFNGCVLNFEIKPVVDGFLKQAVVK